MDQRRRRTHGKESHGAQCEFSRNTGPMRYGLWTHRSEALDQAGRGCLWWKVMELCAFCPPLPSQEQTPAKRVSTQWGHIFWTLAIGWPGDNIPMPGMWQAWTTALAFWDVTGMYRCSGVLGCDRHVLLLWSSGMWQACTTALEFWDVLSLHLPSSCWQEPVHYWILTSLIAWGHLLGIKEEEFERNLDPWSPTWRQTLFSSTDGMAPVFQEETNSIMMSASW